MVFTLRSRDDIFTVERSVETPLATALFVTACGLCRCLTLGGV